MQKGFFTTWKTANILKWKLKFCKTKIIEGAHDPKYIMAGQPYRPLLAAGYPMWGSMDHNSTPING